MQRMPPNASLVRPRKRAHIGIAEAGLRLGHEGAGEVDAPYPRVLRRTTMEMRRRASLQRAKHYGMHCARRWTGNAVGAALCHVAGAFSQNWRA